MNRAAPISTRDPHIAAFLEGADVAALRRRLLKWYARHARDLPWRRTRDPYAVWISEIMLQQTTVAAVIPYYERFVARFPTVYALAEADEHDVLRLWEGLGYYSRGRNLHRAARMIVDEHAGRFPPDVAVLQRLPGIGRYTAGAIASFAFDGCAPIVEANTLRLYVRLLGYRGDPRVAAGQELVWSFADRLLPRRDCGRFNQALMELGATVCTPSDPRCGECPLRRECSAFREGLQHEIPRQKDRPTVTQVIEAAVAIRRRGAYLMRLRQAGERWAGLWDFPRFELQNGHAALDPHAPILHAAIACRVQELTGLAVDVDALATEFTHAVTRYRIRLLCFTAACRGGGRSLPAGDWRWVRPAEFGSVALSVSGRRFSRWLQQSAAERT